MRKPSKEKKVRRIGGTIVASVDEISRVKLNQHLNLDMVSAPVEASVDPELKEARAKMSAAKKAFMADPSVENKREAKAARELFEKVEYTHFLEMDKDKAIRQVRNKMMSMELKAEDLKRKIQGQKMVRLDCQARGDGKGIMKCDQQTMKFEGQCALAIHEGDRYRVMLGHVISGDRTGVTFAEPKYKNDKISLALKIRHAEKLGNTSLAAKYREEMLALKLNDGRKAKRTKTKEAPKKVKNRPGVKLNSERTVGRSAEANKDRFEKLEESKQNARTRSQADSYKINY